MINQLEMPSFKNTIQRLKYRLYLRKVAAKERALEKLRQEVENEEIRERKRRERLVQIGSNARAFSNRRSYSPTNQSI